uniref:Uncharacterized protein n=1 Tax=Photinus pyralis TaxID=7054 RepID=A0A1Y1K8R2_PHOPY
MLHYMGRSYSAKVNLQNETMNKVFVGFFCVIWQIGFKEQWGKFSLTVDKEIFNQIRSLEDESDRLFGFRLGELSSTAFNTLNVCTKWAEENGVLGYALLVLSEYKKPF